MATKYEIRRAVLTIAARLYCPLELKTLLCFDEIIQFQDDAAVAAEWDALSGERYLLPVPGFDTHRALSPRVKALFEAEPTGGWMKDEPFLAGPFAMR